MTQYTEGLAIGSQFQNFVNSGSLNDVKTTSFNIYTANVSNRPSTGGYYFVRTSAFDSNGALQEATRLDNADAYVRTKNNGDRGEWRKKYTGAYYTSSTSASIANLLYTAANACGYSPIERTHAGLISVSTDTIGEYALIWFMYKHGTTGQGISVSHNVISLSAINSSGTVTLTGGTAPYNYGVMFFY